MAQSFIRSFKFIDSNLKSFQVASDSPPVIKRASADLNQRRERGMHEDIGYPWKTTSFYWFSAYRFRMDSFKYSDRLCFWKSFFLTDQEESEHLRSGRQIRLLPNRLRRNNGILQFAESTVEIDDKRIELSIDTLTSLPKNLRFFSHSHLTKSFAQTSVSDEFKDFTKPNINVSAPSRLASWLAIAYSEC